MARADMYDAAVQQSEWNKAGLLMLQLQSFSVSVNKLRLAKKYDQMVETLAAWFETIRPLATKDERIMYEDLYSKARVATSNKGNPHRYQQYHATQLERLVRESEHKHGFLLKEKDSVFDALKRGI